MKKTINFGDEAKDKVTGFKGIVTGLASYMTGCDQCLLSSKSKDGDLGKGCWFDVGRLEVTKKSVIKIKDVTSDKDGADMPAPIK